MTTVAGGFKKASPHVTTLTSTAPSDCITRRCSSSSLAGSLALDRQHPSARSEQRHTPPRQLVQRGHRSGHDRVHLPQLLPHGLFFGSAPDHSDIHAEVVDRPLGGNRNAAEAARSVSPASPAGPTLTVSPAGRLHYRCRQSALRRQAVRRRCAIEQVPIPQPIDLAGADETAFHPVPGQDLRVSPASPRRSPKTTTAPAGGRGRLAMFHVKHPPDPAPTARRFELQLCNSRQSAGRRRGATARRPRSRCAHRRRPPPRRARSCARTASSARAPRARPTPKPAAPPCRPAPPARRGGSRRQRAMSSISLLRSPVF